MRRYISFILMLLTNSIFSQIPEIKIYPFKSAIISYNYDGVASGTHITYIDDYGHKQADYIKKELTIMGQTDMEIKTIILIGERAYTISDSDSTVAIGPNSKYSYYLQNQDKNGIAISEAYLKAVYAVQENGTIDFLDKKCKNWQSRNNKMYTYKGLEVYSETNFMGKLIQKAHKIEIDVNIPDEKFEIPQGYTYISSDTYQGFSGLKLEFENEDNLAKNSDNSKMSFSTNDLESPEKMPYYTQEGEKIIQNGVNDFNKVDYKIIKSQEDYLQPDAIELQQARTLIFKNENCYAKGMECYGKLQISNIDEHSFSYRYMVFDQEGVITGYSNESNSALNKILDISSNESYINLIITPKENTNCYLLGW